MNQKSKPIASHLFKFSPLFLALGLSSALAAEIEKIEVRVQKRVQSAQEVPVAVSAFNGDMMDQLGVEDVRDLVDLTPGFNGKTEDSFIDALSIRGIGTNDFGIGGDPSVAIFTDGVWAGRNGGVQMSFYDMERAEVVKGPQGTLFGRNAIAGGINITTNQPISDFEASFGGTLAEHGQKEMTGMVNIPLTSSVYFRAAANVTREDGWLKNVYDGSRLGGGDVNSTRLGLRYEGDDVDAVLRVTYEDREQDASAYWTSRNGGKKDEVNIDTRGYDIGEIFSVQGNIVWELSDEYSLSSITGYKTYDFEYLEDYDGLPIQVNNYSVDQSVDYFSQEFRLNYDGSGDIYWFIGASVYQEDVEATFKNSYNENDLCIGWSQTEVEDFDEVVTGCDTAVFEAYWEDDIDPADLHPGIKDETNINDLKNSGWSVYGDISWSVTENLELTAGARYTTDKKDMTLEVLDSGGALGNTNVFEYYTDGPIQDDDDWSKFTPRLAAVYELSDDTNIYANWSKGYKSGGFSTFAADHDGSQEYGGPVAEGTKPLKHNPETSTSYEIGTKTMLLEDTLQLNLAYFTYDYKDLQMVLFEGGSQTVRNVGAAENQGIEMDLHWVLGDNWEIRAAAAWMDSEITKEIEEGDGSIGNKLPMAPDFSGSVITTYSVPMDEGELSLTAQYVFQDDVYGGPGNVELSKVDAWSELGLRATYESFEEWSVTLYVDNVTNEEYFERGWENANADDSGGFGLVNTLVWPSKPRTVGVSFNMSF